MLNQSCLALPRSILMTEGRRSLTRTPRLSTRFCPLRAEHTLRRIFQSIAWCRQSSVSVVFLGVLFRQRCHVERACNLTDHNKLSRRFDCEWPGSHLFYFDLPDSQKCCKMHRNATHGYQLLTRGLPNQEFFGHFCLCRLCQYGGLAYRSNERVNDVGYLCMLRSFEKWFILCGALFFFNSA